MFIIIGVEPYYMYSLYSKSAAPEAGNYVSVDKGSEASGIFSCIHSRARQLTSIAEIVSMS